MTEIIQYSCFNIKQESKKELVDLFPPRFPLVVCDHITHTFGYLPRVRPIIESINVVGEIISDNIQVLICEVNGTHIRPDEQVYRILHSKLDAHVPDMSCKAAIAELGLGLFGEFVPIMDYKYVIREYLIPYRGAR